MVDIRDFVAPNLAAGREFGIEVKVMLWINAGTGEMLALQERLLALKARLQVFGKERDLELQIALGEAVPTTDGSLSGPCTLRYGREADGEAVWRVEGNRLVLLGEVGGVASRVAFERQGQRTLIDIAGKKSASLRITAG